MSPLEKDLTRSPETGSAATGPAGDRKLFCIALRAGRLANRLILFANFIALAEEQRHRLVNVTFHSYAEHFETTRRDIYCQYPPPARRSWMDVVPGVAPAVRATRVLYRLVRAACVVNDRFPVWGRRVIRLRASGDSAVTRLEDPAVQAQIAPARVVFIYDWGFRAPQWVQRHGRRIRAFFRPLEPIERASRQAVDRLRQQGEVVVGVHIRQGDYRNWKQGRYFFPASRYAEWMRRMQEQFPGRKVAFFVCSDVPRSAAEFPGLAVHLGGASPVLDLYTLAGCDYVMGPPSTFSQWASFYGEKPLRHFHGQDAQPDLPGFRVSDLGDIPGYVPGHPPGCR
jgi:hypothetical protein